MPESDIAPFLSGHLTDEIALPTFSEDGVAERTLDVAGENQPLQLPGPSREELMALLG